MQLKRLRKRNKPSASNLAAALSQQGNTVTYHPLTSAPVGLANLLVSHRVSSTSNILPGLGQFHNSSVCYGPKCCVEPETWPACIFPDQLPPGEDFDLCRCQLTARPCCTGRSEWCSIDRVDVHLTGTGLYGECTIQTEEQWWVATRTHWTFTLSDQIGAALF